MFKLIRRKDTITNYIIDMHCHVIPEADDGPSDMEEACEILALAEKEGITHLICTPHYRNDFKSAKVKDIDRTFLELKQEAKRRGIKVELFLGNEVLYFQDLDQTLGKGKIHSMNGSSFLLVEFYPNEAFRNIKNAVYHICGLGYTPILAHVERYECFYKNPDYIEELRQCDVRIQVNASSVLGKNGYSTRRFSKRLLDKKWVDYISTDAHSKGKRAPKINSCVKYLYNNCDSDYVKDILYKNALRDFF